MKNHHWLFALLILGSLSYALLWYLFPRFDNAAKIHFRLDHQQTISKAADFLTKNGYDVSGWDSGIRTDHLDETIEYLQFHSPAETEAKLLAPVRFTVRFLDLSKDRSLTVFLAPSGQIAGFKKAEKKLPPDEKSQPFSKEEAQRSFAEIMGDAAPRFQYISESEPEKGSNKFSWKYTSAEDPALTIRAETTYSANKLVEFDLRPSIPDAYKLPRTKPTAALDSLAAVIFVLIFIAACVLYFLNLNRKAIDHRNSLVFMGIVFFVVALTNFLTDGSQGIIINEGGDPISPALKRGLAYSIAIIISMGFALFMGLAWTSGEAHHAKYKTGHLAGMANFLRGKWYSKRFAQCLIAGLFAGGIIAVIPFLTAVLGQLPSLPHLVTNGYDTYNSAWPFWAVALGSLVEGSFFNLTLLFAFLFPVLRTYLKSRWVFIVVIVFFGMLFLIDSSALTSKYSLSLKSVIAAFILSIFFLLYWKFDLLSVIAANTASVLSLKALSLYHQPSSVVHAAGIKALILLGIAVLVSLVLTQLAPNKEIAERELLNADEDQDERARLLAEFGVARKAQEKLLPAEAPQIQGFDIAALCRPARECAGDLFDFIPLSDGKLGIVVADVSGKGVPAALYMTLTKGLLTSISETHSDPGEILREVNKHLYEVCKRKSFVTLALGVLDPHDKTMTYARAGHNPSLWRNATKHKWLKPSGIGLGLNSGKTFDRLLKVEKLQLTADDVLVFYSDGITEAMNRNQEEYGEDRLLAATKAIDGLNATDAMNSIMTDVGNFLGEVPPQDDQTLLVVRVT